MSTETPSALLGTFVRSAQKTFPPDQLAKLDAYSTAVSHTTSKRDPERARRCALWAIEQSADRQQGHPRWREVREVHELWKESWFGAEFGLTGPSGALGPPQEIRIQWVEEAVKVAQMLGQDDGWDQSPWEALLQDLLSME